MQVCRVYIIYLSLFAISFAFEPAKASLEPLLHLRGDEQISIAVSVPYLAGRQSPGDQIGTTWYDLQADCSYGQRIMVDGYGQAHIDWMKRDASGSNRYCAWNARFSTGSYYGETQASQSWSGYAKIDITRDADPDSQRSVITYHYNPGAGYYAFIDIDAGNLWGAWGNPRSPQIADYIWPTICVADNNNIILATGDYDGNMHHVILTTDEGETWSQMLDLDSCSNLSRFLRASHNPGSNKAVFVHTRYITDSVAAGQLDNNIWYTLSTDGGVSWGLYTNITNYQPYPVDSVRAYCDVNAIFDNNDNLHIVWGGRKVTDNYYSASKIFHWDEINDTITIINSPSIYYNEPGGWWIEGSAGAVGAWRLPADEPQLVSDTTNGYLYCLWHGNDDYNDYSAAGYFNGEIFGAYSSDYGITWSDYVNLTNTRTPGAGPGACHDEDYMTACLYVFNDSIWTTYIEDKDAGAYPHTEGIETENPVRCWIFPTSLITGIEEDQGSSAKFQELILKISPNPFSKLINISFGIGHPDRIDNSSYGTGRAEGQTLRIFDASGRLIKDFFLPTAYSLVPTTIKWSGTDRFDRPVPAGVYFVELTAGDESITEKVIKLR